MSDAVAAEMFIGAIKKFAHRPDNLDNLESYLSNHFTSWLELYAKTPQDLASEMKMFADMEI